MLIRGTVQKNIEFGCKKCYQKINQKNFPFISINQNDSWQCVEKSEFLRIPKWVYDELIRFVYRHQSENLCTFIGKWMQLSNDEVLSSKMYQKAIVNKYPKATKIPVILGNIYLIREGQVQLNYEYVAKQNSNSKQSITIAGEGTIISPQKESKFNTILSIKSKIECYVIEWDNKTIKSLFNNIKGYEKIFQKLYKQIRIKKQNFFKIYRYNCLTQHPLQLSQNYNNMRIGPKKCLKRFRRNNDKISFSDLEQKEFMSCLLYEKLIQGKQKIIDTMQQHKQKTNKMTKIVHYLKKNTKKKQNNEKVMKIKLKSIAEKQMNLRSSTKLTNEIKRKKGLFDQKEQDDKQFRQFEQEQRINNQLYLSNNDTGLINEFAKESHNYQKQISFLLKNTTFSFIDKENKNKKNKKSYLRTQNNNNNSNNNIFTHEILKNFKKKINEIQHNQTQISCIYSSTIENNFIKDQTPILNNNNIKYYSPNRKILHRLKSGASIKIIKK